MKQFSCWIAFTIIVTIATGQDFLGGSIIRFSASTNTIVKEVDLGLIMGNLVQADDGLFYGLVHTGTSNQMMIFSYDHLTKELSNRYLIDTANSTFANLGLIKGTDGLLYGYNSGGGAHQKGYIFSYNIHNGQFLRHFDFNESEPEIHAFTQLTQAGNGLFYGYSSEGRYGSIIYLDFSSGERKTLHYFTAIEGSSPRGRLLLAKDGLFYGHLGVGFGEKGGALFSFDPETLDVNILVRYSGALDGTWPYGGLIQATNGKIYGTTTAGWYGTVFSFDPSSQEFKVLQNFTDPSNGSDPYGTLTEGSNGLLYGVAGRVLFSVNPVTDEFSRVLSNDLAKSLYTPGNQLTEISTKKRSTSLTYIGATSVQYSDSLLLKAVLKNSFNNQPIKDKHIRFQFGDRQILVQTNQQGIAESTILVGESPGIATVNADFPGDENHISSSSSNGVTILPEDLRITYTGPLYASTFNTNSTSSRINLSVTVSDISAVLHDPAYDPDKGDVQKAHLEFLDLDKGIVIGTALVQLIDNTNSAVGTAVLAWDVDLNQEKIRRLRLGIKISGYYQSLGSVTEIEVSKAVPASLNGAGVVNSSSGKHPFHLKLMLGGKGISGTAVFRNITSSQENVEVSQVSFYSFGISACNRITLNGIGKLTHKRFQGGPVIIDNALIQWEVETAKKGKLDSIKLTSWDMKGKLILSSAWSGVQTNFAGISGNIMLEGCQLQEATITRAKPFSSKENLIANIYPNPGVEKFTLQIDGNTDKKLQIIVFDKLGRLKDQFTTQAGRRLNFGYDYLPGIYRVIIVDGNQTTMLSIIKTGN